MYWNDVTCLCPMFLVVVIVVFHTIHRRARVVMMATLSSPGVVIKTTSILQCHLWRDACRYFQHFEFRPVLVLAIRRICISAWSIRSLLFRILTSDYLLYVMFSDITYLCKHKPLRRLLPPLIASHVTFYDRADISPTCNSPHVLATGWSFIIFILIPAIQSLPIT